jgi:SpoVK/Ycf46/Vps4 family AAA+-type ATPase
MPDGEDADENGLREVTSKRGLKSTREPSDKVSDLGTRIESKPGWPPIPRDSEKGFPLLQVREQYFSLRDLIVRDEVKDRIEYVIAENRAAERLRSHGLKPKQKVLLCGPPGTGKTLTAKIISSVLGYPFVYILFDSIVSSYLGETATNLRRIFDFIEKGRWAVLFDEFDIVGKKRDDPHEHGEVKRVVNNFMQMIDNYEGNSILIAATNHPHLLDIAIWRRFDEVIYFELPDTRLREQLFNKYLGVLRRSGDVGLTELAKMTNGFSPADIAQVCENALRKSIVGQEQELSRRTVLWAVAEQKRKKKIMVSGK